METNKVLSFSNKQKNLIYKRFVQPQNGTIEECEQFIEICETFGLNPLLNDIVFQKFNKRVNFITTRDGLLRVATRQKGYVGAPVANVVKEGDEFEFIPSEGKVYHKFGTKRGKILGAYAVMQHAVFKPVAVFVDFEEYYNANSGLKKGGKPNAWDSMPSAMIQKVAEVFVLRRQFPLGGLYTREEMAIQDDQAFDNPSSHISFENQEQSNDHTEMIKEEETENQPLENVPDEQPQENEILTDEQRKELLGIIQSISQERNVSPDTVAGALGKPLISFKQSEYKAIKDKLIDWLEKAKKANENEQASNADEKEVQSEQQQQTEDSTPNLNQFVLVDKLNQETPSGMKFLQVFVEEEEDPLFVRNKNTINKINSIEKGNSFVGKTKEENGFVFLEEVFNQNIA